MNLQSIIPKPNEILREGLIVIGGVLLAAFVISRFPKLQAFVQSNSITLKDSNGNILWG